MHLSSSSSCMAFSVDEGTVQYLLCAHVLDGAIVALPTIPCTDMQAYARRLCVGVYRPVVHDPNERTVEILGVIMIRAPAMFVSFVAAVLRPVIISVYFYVVVARHL